MTTNRNAERDARDLLFIFKQPGVFGSSFPFNTAISWHAWNSECCLINHHFFFFFFFAKEPVFTGDKTPFPHLQKEAQDVFFLKKFPPFDFFLSVFPGISVK